MSVKLSDFGSAMDLKDRLRPEKAAESLQPRFYRAPEVILGQPYDTQIDVPWTWVCFYNSVHLCVGLLFFCALPSAPSVCRRRPPHNSLSHTTFTHNCVTHNSFTRNFVIQHNSFVGDFCVAGVAGDIDVTFVWQSGSFSTGLATLSWTSVTDDSFTQLISVTTLSHTTLSHATISWTSVTLNSFTFTLILARNRSSNLLGLSCLCRPASTPVWSYWKKLTCDTCGAIQSLIFFPPVSVLFFRAS